jgi:hypothetical protein
MISLVVCDLAFILSMVFSPLLSGKLPFLSLLEMNPLYLT